MAADEPSEFRAPAELRGPAQRSARESAAELFAPLERALAEAAARHDSDAVRELQDTLHATLHARLSPGLQRHFQRKLARQTSTNINPRHTADRADELTQRTWIAFWEALRKGKYDPAKSGLSTFLYAVSHIVWMRFHRELSRASFTSGFELHESTNAAHPSHAAQDATIAGELAEQVSAVRSLLSASPGSPPADMEPLSVEDRHLLRAISQGRTDRELAAELGTSASTAHARKKAALARLGRVLARLGLLPGAAEEDGAAADSRRAPPHGKA